MGRFEPAGWGLIVCGAVSAHILAIDQGTTGSTALVMDTHGRTLGRANREFAQHFPKPGWVEHEPDEIWESVVDSVCEAISSAAVRGDQIGAIGITNQRETTVVWERATGRAIHRAIVWQDRRTADRCAELKGRGHEARVRETTGLVLDPYFSGTKLEWLLDNVDGARARANQGELAFGTMDSFLVHRLAGGSSASAPHVIEVSNASRTLLMDLARRAWDPAMCELLRVPPTVLPKIVPTAGEIARTHSMPGLPDGIVIAGMAGDQQAALFGQACFGVGDAKCTYGTGAFVLVNAGSQPVVSRSGLLSTVGWQIGPDVVYALEGSSFIAGAAVQWLRDGLGLIASASEVETLAASVDSSDGVSFVPALSGLGAPYWDPEARGLICGLTRGSTRAHLARATLEGIALSVNDLLGAMAADLGEPLGRMRVDGGAAANDLLMQFQSDVGNLVVERPSELESTARGAAMLAGIGAGLFRTGADASQMITVDRTFQPSMAEAVRSERLAGWRDAVRRSRSV
jgi:glycerol kinase